MDYAINNDNDNDDDDDNNNHYDNNDNNNINFSELFDTSYLEKDVNYLQLIPILL